MSIGSLVPLVGRSAELRVLFGLLDRDSAATLVVHGEPGIGKTALLEAVKARAAAPVLSTAGVPSEADLPFSGLHQLLLPLLDRVEEIPERQREALGAALGADAVPDRFLVGLAVLTLLSETAPLVCVIDDAQWLDPPSLQTLALVARRLSAEPVVMLFAASEPCDDLRGLAELTLEGLSDDAASELLSTVVPGRLDERVRERILAEARGNPLALLELPAGELAGGFGLPLTGRFEEHFLREVDALPAGTQRLLLVAAAEPVGDPALLWRAAERLGIAFEAPAELLEVDLRVRFRHPLLRAAIYRVATPEERRLAHQALADVTDPDIDPDRRAWHRAKAAAGPDEEVAAELEGSAARAQARGGSAAAAAFLARAVELTVDPVARTRRALAAAAAKFEAAAPDAALALLATAELGPLDELQRARIERLRAQIAFARTGWSIGREAPALLLDAARRLEPLDVELARETYLEAITAAMCTGSVRAVAEAAREAPRGPQRPVDVLLDTLVARFTEPYAAAPLRRALHTLAATDDARWLWFACPIAPEPLALDLWDDEKWHELSTRAVRICRDAGALSVLPQALTYRASMHVLGGEFAAAATLIDEAHAITAATGNPPLPYPSMLLAAWRGDEAEALSVIGACIADARARGLERSLGMAQCLTALLYNGLGRYQDALVAAQRAREYGPNDDLDDLGPPGWALIELIEAAVRSDRRDLAVAGVEQLSVRTQASGTEWALGIEARSRALVSSSEALYVEAIERLARTRIRVELPRARLHYGEWLRREGRRVDARDQLRRAHDAFASMGAGAFAERARRELAATGERLRRRDAARDRLTPQEEQIAGLARDGFSNPEIAGQMFLSTRTVEWHLNKVFAKLDIGSRMGLHAALPKTGESTGANSHARARP